MKKNQYLDKIPDPILNLIKDENNKLTSFYNEMRKRIKEDNFQNISYSSDIVFNNTMQYNKNKENGNPFFHYIRTAVMTPEHFKKYSIVWIFQKKFSWKFNKQDLPL